MQKIKDGVKTSVMLKQRQLQQMDKIAQSTGVKRSETHRVILDAGLRVYASSRVFNVSKLRNKDEGSNTNEQA